MSNEAIRIECPGCHARFRMRSRGSSGRSAVKCPKCATRIPLPEDAPPPPQKIEINEAPLPPAPVPKASASDDDLRKMLRRAKKRRRSDVHKTNGEVEADRTIPDLPTLQAATPDDTEPEFGTQTMPMGRSALTARDLGTDYARGDDRIGAATIRRKRLDTPRAGSMVPAPALRAPVPPAEIERPVVDEPTYTGPMPGRTPHITPSGSDLSRFLEPGNYCVRVDESVYEPVTEKELVRLLNAGVFFAIDELRPEGGDWIAISSPALFADLKGRLAHRAHHMLARVVQPRPASDFGRPPPEPDPLPELAPLAIALEEPPSIIVDEAGLTAPEPTAKKQFPLAIVGVVGVALVLVFGGVVAAVVSSSSLFAGDTSSEEDVDAANLAILAAENAGVIDPVPAFQSATAGITSAHAVATSIDGMLKAAQHFGDEDAATILAFEKWKRQPGTVEANPLIAQLMQRKHWQAARQVANWAVVTSGSTKELEATIETSLRRQFESEEPIEVTAKRFSRIARIDPGKRPAIVLQDKAGGQWLAWPDMGDDDWRNDVAAYRLCQLIVCHFRVPETREMRMSKDTLAELLKGADQNAAEMTERLRGDFDWDKDGVLRGSLREVPPGAPWPIELSQIWRPWLTAGAGTSQLEDAVEEAHHQVAFFGAERVYPELHGMRARQLARQVSSILLVDYVVNNWNRFAPNEENWGSRTRIDDGLVISVEDSAAFDTGESMRAQGRFSWSKRFSRATVESLEDLDKELAEEFLFPSPSKAEKEKLEDMWQRRSRAMRRINQLIKRYGAADVYALDAEPK